MALDVLLLEDDPAKKTRLLALLNERKDLFSRVDTVICASDARRNMGERQYDLFVADVVVPKELGGAKSEEHCIALFEEMDDGHGEIHCPSFSLPMSSSGELSDAAHDFFRGRPWGILPYTETTEDCLLTVEKVAKFVLNEKTRNAERPPVDVFILTALMEPEFAALEGIDFQWKPFEPLDRSQLVRFGTIQSDGREYSVAAGFSQRMGPVAASILTMKALLAYRPSVVAMAGICAGIPGKADIGDVIATEISWDWQSGKYVDKNGAEGFQIAPHQLGIHDTCRNALWMLKRDDEFWRSLAPRAIEAKVKQPRLVLGPMATGSSVLADTRVADRIKENQHKNVAGLDMETYGVFAAAQAYSHDTKVVSLKSVCDKGDIKKNDRYQSYAASVSALALHRFLSQHLRTLLDER
jgi:nucleoside phosphorylase